MTWKMEIVDEIRNPVFRAALIQGHPRDLCWYENGRLPDQYLLVDVQNQYFYWFEGEKAREVFLKIKEGKENVGALITQGEVVLRWPAEEGLIWGDVAQVIDRKDSFYNWLVESVKPTHLSNVAGLKTKNNLSDYRLVFRTLPDHQFIDFIPGVGIEHYQYGHHGTISEVDMHLVEVHLTGD